MILPKSSIREFEHAVAKGWEEDVSLDELLARVNRVASKLFPVGEAEDGRVSPVLVARTFRHYTTLGCIDPGRRVGRQVVYGLRHVLQALLVRRLLADGVPVRRMPELVSGSDNGELRRMVLEGVEVVVRAGTGSGIPARIGLDSDFPCSPESWSRTRLAPGVELHLREGLPHLKPAERKRLIGLMEEILRAR
jgi:DNA-binding transcriptional MerR regulator